MSYTKLEPSDVPPSDPPPAYDAAQSQAGPAQKSGPPRPPPFGASLASLQALRTKRVILASASPRRKQILGYLGLGAVEVIPCTEPEDFPKSMSPFEYVLATATKKAQTIYRQEIDNEEKGEPALIIAADTVVVEPTSGEIMEKPRSEAQHITMLKTLRDKRDHKVYTAICVMAPLQSARDPGYAMETYVEETNVRFDGEVTDDLLLAYVKTREGADKAGGYGMQGLGSVLIEKVDGSYDNVIGLPLRTTLRLIEKTLAKGDDEDLLGGEDEEDEELED